MFGRKLIFNSFANRLSGTAASQEASPRATKEQAKTIKKMAAHLKVRESCIRALAKGDPIKLAESTTGDLERLRAYLRGVAAKQAKRDKGNGTVLLAYTKTLQDASAHLEKVEAARDRARHVALQELVYTRATRAASQAGAAALKAALPDVPGRARDQSTTKRLQSEMTLLARAQVKRLHDLASTPKEKDAANLAAGEIERLLNGKS